MATLTETAYYVRRAINWTILAVISYLLLRLFWTGLIGLILVIFPPQAPPPDHAFGRLPPVKFPQTASPAAQISFRLETIEGSVPRASDSAAVYFMPKNPANLLALSRTQEFAERLQLNNNPIQESKNIYRFLDDQFPLRSMRFDIVSNNFILRYNFEQDATAFLEKDLTLLESAPSEARSLLQTYGLYQPDIARGRTQVTYLKLGGNLLLPTTSLSTADAVRVDFFRADLNSMPIVSAPPEEGLITTIFSGAGNNKKRLLQLAYTYWPIDEQTVATYPLKTSSQAWQELQSGTGLIARYPNQGTTATVRNIYLAYYESLEPQTYLQPVFVFSGDYDFLAYIPAISPEWTEN